MTARGQTHAKREREFALREKRERKRAKKVETAAQRALGIAPTVDSGTGAPAAEGRAETALPEWIQ
jgi:hypothetical protein